MPYSVCEEYRTSYDLLRDLLLSRCTCGGHHILDSKMMKDLNQFKDEEDMEQRSRVAVGDCDQLGEIEVIPHESVWLRKDKDGNDPLIELKDSDLCGKTNDKNGAEVEMGAFISKTSTEQILNAPPRSNKMITLVYPCRELVDWRTAMTEMAEFLSPFDLKQYFISGLTSHHLWIFMKNRSMGSLFNTSKQKQDLSVNFFENYKKVQDFRILFMEGFNHFLNPKTGYIEVVLNVSAVKELYKGDNRVYKCSVCQGMELLCGYGDLYDL
ncbi:hypothetical protein BWQ96_05973 [Gracilariopsis chorda]|uniref:Uncharacterized protein n=1 Tax=Gracilariopsis chorda TaxID=448386 RepID=A0A2V3IQB9_9FLOR|nr:hypothetical protein BWQ96_05973 [Gracilariopsis chorda]|eukprot:PXF44269.1 hypothetical protein BWQ96_05973 [Gracilariopsis chorda]